MRCLLIGQYWILKPSTLFWLVRDTTTNEFLFSYFQFLFTNMRSLGRDQGVFLCKQIVFHLNVSGNVSDILCLLSLLVLISVIQFHLRGLSLVSLSGAAVEDDECISVVKCLLPSPLHSRYSGLLWKRSLWAVVRGISAPAPTQCRKYRNNRRREGR